MKFYDLAWAAVCFQYRSAGDKKYCEIIRDRDFITKLRHEPYEVTAKEFEAKVILNYIDIAHYDLLMGHNFSHQILTQIINLQSEISVLEQYDILTCDLEDSRIESNIIKLYSSFSNLEGLWVTGTSKILHLLNDRLFAPLNRHLVDELNISTSDRLLIDWLRILQKEARVVDNDFREQGFEGSIDAYLSDQLGYTKYDCQKSLVKFIDEYYWLTVTDGMVVPPPWIPKKPLKRKTKQYS
jgi:hypothetical protein